MRIVQPGRLRYVSAHIVMPETFESGRPADLDEIRARTWSALQADLPVTILDVVFTADSRWGADTDQSKR